jgi:regulator of sigma E protease
VITAVDGVAVSNFYDVVREIRKYSDERITIDWRLDEQTAGNVALEVGAGEEYITVFAEFIPFEDMRKTYKASGPIGAVQMGYRKTVMFIAQTYVTLKRLVGGLVSPKNLMGPVGIITFSYRIVAEQPLIYYVYFLGLISAVIAVFNFLPLPPLDGGLVVLLLVEKVKGSALSERVQTIVAYTGWTLIGTLILYVTFNDIVRNFFS